MLPRFKAAAVHAAPVFLDSRATTEKAISIIREAARAGAELIAFPETYHSSLPGLGRAVASDRQSRPVRPHGRAIRAG